MTQGVIVWVLLIGLAGLIWVMVLDILCYDPHSHDKQQGSAAPEPRDGYELHDTQPGSQQSRSDKGM
jgi:hypothetical protein